MARDGLHATATDVPLQEPLVSVIESVEEYAESASVRGVGRRDERVRRETVDHVSARKRSSSLSASTDAVSAWDARRSA